MRKSRGQRGEGQFGCIVGLILLGIAIFVAYKMIPVKVRTAEMRGAVVDEAKAAGTHNDEHIRAALLAKAQQEHLPVTDQDIRITRAQSTITIDVDYVVPIDFPGKTYEWHINHHAENPIF